MTDEKKYVGACVVAACIACVCSFIGLQAEPPTTSLFSGEVVGERAGWLILVSLLTAMVEELIFRGLLFQGLQRIMRNGYALWVSSLAFGILHALPLGIDPNADLVSMVFGLILKFIQATLFGVLMARLIVEGKSIAFVIGIHWLFDIIYFAPLVLTTGDFPSTYQATTPLDVVMLLITSVILALPLFMMGHLRGRKKENHGDPTIA